MADVAFLRRRGGAEGGAPTREFGGKTYYLGRFSLKIKEICPGGGDNQYLIPTEVT